MSRAKRLLIFVALSALCVLSRPALGVDLPRTQIGKDGAMMVLVPAGPFVMGGIEGKDDEKPPHAVELPAFYIDKFEVTHEQYGAFLRATGYKAPITWPDGKLPAKLARHPVVNVTFADAAAYAQWAGKRLPTEAEWEKAARGNDGRRYPWGDSLDGKKFAVPVGDNAKDHAWPVGSFPDDIAPCGAMDMGGNVCEWTASWYDAYPGNDQLEIEYGKKYRAIRGGGAIEYYGVANTIRCAARGRSLPYGSYDGLGFRCALSADKDSDLTKGNEGNEAQSGSRHQLPASLSGIDVPPPGAPASLPARPEGRPLAGKDAGAPGLRKLTVTEDLGIPRTNGQVTSGVPFPMGAVSINSSFRLLDEQGGAVPLQARVTATWRDGSVKWVLLDFPATLAANQSRQFILKNGPGILPGPALADVKPNGEIGINTGPLKLVFSRERPGFLRFAGLRSGSDQETTPVIRDALAPSLVLARDQAPLQIQVQSPDQLEIEENGHSRAVVKASGWITDSGSNRLVRYVTRVTAFASSARLQVQHTIIQLSDVHPKLRLLDHSLFLPLADNQPRQYAFGGNRGAHTGALPANALVSLSQLAESCYEVRSLAGTDAGAPSPGGPTAADSGSNGLKAPGWVHVQGANGGVLAAVRHFWQQFPKAIEISPAELRLELYPAEAKQPFDLDQGLGKTHSVLLLLHPGDMALERCAEEAAIFAHPLFAIAPAQWYCDTKVFGELLPFDFDRFPDYETLVEAGGDQLIKRMSTGLRNWGDVYYGGEYKGTNSYTNLEYDMHHNFLVQFARTGLRKYLDPAFIMAQHQADIDTNHKTGWQWKHSPRHTEIQAEFGHAFTRGLLENYFLSGNPACLEAARELGDYFAREIRNPRALGNERQIGWALISLLPVYEATWDPKYFVAASNTVDRLLAGLDANGKFNIRWDNRIAFFNGIAATGLLYYYRATGDERVADAAFRVIRRARGFYPEYNGRTLEAIAWAYQRTGEPEWLDFLARTWETTMARQISWNVMELGAPASLPAAVKELRGPFIVWHCMRRILTMSATAHT